METLKSGYYRNKAGLMHKVKGIAKHTETEENFIVLKNQFGYFLEKLETFEKSHYDYLEEQHQRIETNILPEEKVKKGIYEHYKGNRYEVFFIAQYLEQQQKLVVYADGSGFLWTRPIDMWAELVNGVPRFKLI